MAKCMIVTNGIADKKGKPSIEFYKNRKPIFLCRVIILLFHVLQIIFAIWPLNR